MGKDRGFQSKVKQILKDNGWQHVRSNCSHEIFQHPDKPNSVPLPYRINYRGFALEILRNQAGIKGARL